MFRFMQTFEVVSSSAHIHPRPAPILVRARRRWRSCSSSKLTQENRAIGFWPGKSRDTD